MYSFRLTCRSNEVDTVSGELWEAGTIGIRELDQGEETVLIAFFESNVSHQELLERFARYAPQWKSERSRDWVADFREAWGSRSIGERLFLVPIWRDDPTPPGRIRLVHNPGLACGTGEHPCTQLALMALEKCIVPGCTAVDIGTGSGILAVAAIQLGAVVAVGVDVAAGTLETARENFLLNTLPTPLVAAGSADCLSTGCSDVTVANISGTVLLSILDDLRRITRDNGFLILTGFPEWELSAFQQEFPGATVAAIDEWRCITARLSSSA
jgi:ribosomal protein L11 methyltransferase